MNPETTTSVGADAYEIRVRDVAGAFRTMYVTKFVEQRKGEQKKGAVLKTQVKSFGMRWTLLMSSTFLSWNRSRHFSMVFGGFS